LKSGSELSLSPAATSISFGGKSAKSRYLCVSDEGGSASVWDMKKISRVRCFKMKNVDSVMDEKISGNGHRPSCIKCCMDPSDTYVVALHGDSSLTNKSKRIALELFHLKTGSRVALLKTNEYAYGGGADCFEFSNADNGQLLVGARDGSLLLWDCSVTAIAANTNTRGNSWGPMSVLENRHQGAVMDVAFSPMNKVLAASCSIDGTVAFHDVNSKKTIQTIRPWDRPVKFLNKVEKGTSGKGFTSLAFHHDGYTWAAGTEKGIVFTYDLRQTGNGPLCTMDVSGSANDQINRLQFLQAKPAIAPKSAVKKTVSLAEDGDVTVEHEKTTPSRKEISKTVYSLQKDQPSLSSSTGAGMGTLSSNGKPLSTRTEKIVKRSTTTSKTISSPPRRTVVGGSNTFNSPPPETKVESTSTNEVTTSSSQQPSTTKRITKSKITTSSPQRSVTPMNHKDSVNSSTKTKDPMFDGSMKKDVSVSFDDHKRKIPFNDLTFGDEASLGNDSSDSDAEHMMEDFDKMYERIKSRALRDEKPVHKGPPEINRESADLTDNNKVETVNDEMISMSKVSTERVGVISRMIISNHICFSFLFS
jgi:hypothetical protein